jgi:F-type H+-transporting ATPase subunit b
LFSVVPSFAEEEASGIGAFNINLKGFLFQLITFVLVLFVLKKWVLPPLISTMDARREAVEKSLEHAKETEELLAKAEQRSEEIIAKARIAADQALAEAKKATVGILADAEEAATSRANIIIKEAESHLTQERDKLHQELRAELGALVADATEKVINEKIDDKKDSSLIERAIKAVAR